MTRFGWRLVLSLGVTACRDAAAPEAGRLSAPMFSLVTSVTTTDLGVGSAVAVNDLGQVVGNSLALGGGFILQDGAMTPLSTAFRTGAAALNRVGQVVGSFTAADGLSHPFRWENGVLTDIGTLPGYHGSAADVNDEGYVVGVFATGTGTGLGFIWGEDTGPVFLEAPGPTVQTLPRAVNNVSQVVGRFRTAAGQAHPFSWRQGVLTDLGTLGGEGAFGFFGGEAADINEAGQVVGDAVTVAGDIHAFLWHDGVMTDLGTLGGTTSFATDINEAGQVVGVSTTGSGQSHAYRWENGVMTDLGPGRAWAINDLGHVAGQGAVSAVLWRDGAPIDLGTLGGAFTVSSARGLNNHGLVVGHNLDPIAAVQHATVWSVTLRAATPAEEVALLEDAVADLVTDGTLGDAQATALRSILGAVERSIEAGRTQAARVLLEAFQQVVRARVRRGELTPEQGAALIAAAQAVIDQLE